MSTRRCTALSTGPFLPVPGRRRPPLGSTPATYISPLGSPCGGLEGLSRLPRSLAPLGQSRGSDDGRSWREYDGWGVPDRILY
jgi:hypothetical protein